MNKKIWLSLAKMGGREREFIREAFETNWVAPLGPNVTGFEKDLEAYFDSDTHIVALSSGTAAIHLALIQLGVEAGDRSEFSIRGFGQPHHLPRSQPGICGQRTRYVEHVARTPPPCHCRPHCRYGS